MLLSSHPLLYSFLIQKTIMDNNYNIIILDVQLFIKLRRWRNFPKRGLFQDPSKHFAWKEEENECPYYESTKLHLISLRCLFQLDRKRQNLLSVFKSSVNLRLTPFISEKVTYTSSETKTNASVPRYWQKYQIIHLNCQRTSLIRFPCSAMELN